MKTSDLIHLGSDTKAMTATLVGQLIDAKKLTFETTLAEIFPNLRAQMNPDMAKVTPADYVIDLGSGDGRLVITAAKRGARALGIEYNPDLVELERPMGAGETRDEITQRVSDRFGERLGYADGQCGSERVPNAPGILDGQPAFLPGDADADRASGGFELGQDLSARAPSNCFGRRQVTDPAQ